MINLNKLFSLPCVIRQRIKQCSFFSSNLEYHIIGITRIRNEEDILSDTLAHVSEFVDAIIIYDDCSTDQTISVAKKCNKVIRIIRNKHWSYDRITQETVHRQILLEAAKEYNPEWIFYFDADERFDLTKDVFASVPSQVDGIRIRLYDAYITPEDAKDYVPGERLWGFRKFFGPEYRDILMAFRNRDYIYFEGSDAREPVGCKCVSTHNCCQHYGKSISVAQWEETCSYYASYFPEPYRSKWENRKGKAIHLLSDFGRELYTWEDVKKNGIPL